MFKKVRSHRYAYIVLNITSLMCRKYHIMECGKVVGFKSRLFHVSCVPCKRVSQHGLMCDCGDGGGCCGSVEHTAVGFVVPLKEEVEE